jgi:hypothetical protein
MPKGEDTRHHSNRKVTKDALGSRYVEIGVGFGDDPRVQKDIAEQQAMWSQVDPSGDRFNGPSESEEEEEQRQAFAETHGQIRKNMSEGKYMGEMED